MSKKSSLQNVRHACEPLVLAAAASLFLMQTVPSTASAEGSDRSALKNYQHVFIIMMENTGYSALIGNPNAPFINFAPSLKAGTRPESAMAEAFEIAKID